VFKDKSHFILWTDKNVIVDELLKLWNASEKN